MLFPSALLENLPALQVVLPLLAAPLCLLLGRARPAWALATLVAWLGLAISLTLLWQVRDGAVLHYAFGDWPAPWGIEYVVDRLAAYVLLIVSLIAAVVMPYARKSIAQEIAPALQPLAYTLLLLCLAGLLGMAITGDAFNLFVLLEISSLSSYALISLGRDRRALTAAYQYLIMGTIGATFFIIGVGLLYVMTGTLNMADLAERLPAMEQSRTVRTAFAFITVGLALKLAMFPLHLWLPNAYTFAPSVVTAFLAATATKVALYAMIRFIYTVFGPQFAFDQMHLEWLLLPLAGAGVLVASVVAVFQHDIKRMLAYSSVAQISYMLLGIAMDNVTGLTAALLHLFNHALMKGALFLALGALFYSLSRRDRDTIAVVDRDSRSRSNADAVTVTDRDRLSRTDIDAIAGIAREMPLTMAAFVVGGLSLIGVPLTVGFLSKWYLILAAIEHGWWPVVMLILVSSLIAVLYVWRVVEAAYFQERPAGAAAVREAPAGLLIPIWLLVFANLYFGIDSSLTVGVASDAAHGLFGVSR